MTAVSEDMGDEGTGRVMTTVSVMERIEVVERGGFGITIVSVDAGTEIIITTVVVDESPDVAA